MTDTDRHAWERPGAFEVAPGVYRIPLPLPNDGLHAVNVYAVVDGNDVAMVDSGWALEESEALLEHSLNEIGFDLGSIGQFLVTHIHRDHYTQAVAIRKRFGTRVLLGEHEKPTVDRLLTEAEAMPHAIKRRLARAGAQELLGQLARHPLTTDAVDLGVWDRPDDWLSDGTVLSVGSRRLHVIETPGHTAGHVVFHEPDRGLLFSGDHVLPHITPSIGFETVPPESPLSLYIQSLKLVAAMDDAVLLPAHGPAGGSTRSRVVELLAHHDHRLADTERAVRGGHATGCEVARNLLWTSRHRTYAELDLFNRMIAVNETLAHLDVLVEHGRLGRAEDGGVDLFSA